MVVNNSSQIRNLFIVMDALTGTNQNDLAKKYGVSGRVVISKLINTTTLQLLGKECLDYAPKTRLLVFRQELEQKIQLIINDINSIPQRTKDYLCI